MKGWIRLRHVAGACAAALSLGACGGGLQGDEAAAGAPVAVASQAQSVSGCSGGTCGTQRRVEGDGAVQAQMEEEQSPMWANVCSGLVPTVPTWRIIDTKVLTPTWTCGNGTSDGMGTLALEENLRFEGVDRWDLLPVSGGAKFGAILGYDIRRLLPQPSGFLGLSNVWFANQLWLQAWAHNGTPIIRTRIDLGSADVVSSRRWTDAPDPNGGALVLYSSISMTGNHFFALRARRFNADGTPVSNKIVRAGPHGEQPAWMVGGVGRGDESLVVFDSNSAELGHGRIAAVWLDRWGNPLTPVFDAGPAFSGMDTAQLELAPLYDGSLALQVNGMWVLRFPRRATFSTPAPMWLADHPGTKLVWIRQRRGYALLPRNPEYLVRCTQTAYIFAKDGTFCGYLAFMMSNAPCTTAAIDIGRDGTVIQELPPVQYSTGEIECSRQWWPRLLQ